jgi:hypothetical protein
MKTLNARATEILNKMVSMMEDGYAKINNSEEVFMPVVVEEIFNSDKFKIVSIAHYYEQNGDLAADPEMCFVYFKGQNIYAPSYFKQDGGLAIEQESILFENGEITGIRIKMQADHAAFANMWLKNIQQQQNL